MPNDRTAERIAHELHLRQDQVERTLRLYAEGNTIPFVARYRKEITGGLDEEQLRAIQERGEYLTRLGERRDSIRTTIEEQGKLTPELAARLAQASTLQELEDLYLPYRPRRRTRATRAREAGLEPLAKLMAESKATTGDPEVLAVEWVTDEVPTAEDALAGARDIVAEAVAEDAESRAALRQRLSREAVLRSELRSEDADPTGTYRMYHDYHEPLHSMPPHRVLAINRGEAEDILRVTISVEDERHISWLQRRAVSHPSSIWAPHVRVAVADGYGRLLRPALERDIRRERTARAQERAIAVFGANLRGLLLQPPIRGARILAIDPGQRTGCKVALVDETGRYLASATIYPHAPQRQWDAAKATLETLIAQHEIDIVAIGNGTASRETEALVAETIAEGTDVSYVMVSEAGASIYSASPLAGRELPDLDVTIRGAVSIARRLQDPLAELVKIDPQHVGVGLYQHDVDEAELRRALVVVVESAVNSVGVHLNSASPALLEHIAGLGPGSAQAIVAHRDETGPFRHREHLLQVRGIGPKTYQQAVGFLRVPESPNPLDNTSIHPEAYEACQRLFGILDVDVATTDDLAGSVRAGLQRLEAERMPETDLAQRIGVGVPTLRDMIRDLLRPGRDPRDDLPAPILRQDVLRIEDLHEGMVLKGTVRNVVDFGAFVDIGVKQDGLVHISEMAEEFVRDPFDVVAIGQVVQVRVISVEQDRGRIGLSLKGA